MLCTLAGSERSWLRPPSGNNRRLATHQGNDLRSGLGLNDAPQGGSVWTIRKRKRLFAHKLEVTVLALPPEGDIALFFSFG